LILSTLTFVTSYRSEISAFAKNAGSNTLQIGGRPTAKTQNTINTGQSAHHLANGTCPPSQQPVTCPDGSQPDAAGNCLTATLPPANLQAQPPATTCPDGSQPDAAGNCPPPQQPVTCPDGSTPAADGSCPPPPISNPAQPCIDNPAVGLTCPSTPQETTPPTSPYSWYSGEERQKST
jgi:hypothetical protein